MNYTRAFMAVVMQLGIRPGLTLEYQPRLWDLTKDLSLTEEEEKRVYDVVNQPGFGATLPVIPEAVEGIKQIAKFADIFFVTSPLKTNPTWAYDREQVIKKLFGEELERNIISTHVKYTVAGDVFVDDKPKHCLRYMQHWPLAQVFCWVPPSRVDAYQTPGLPCLYSWPALLDVVRILAGMHMSQRTGL